MSAAERPYRLLRAKQVADMLGVSETWVREHANRSYPKIPAIRLGASLRFHPSDIEAWLNRMREESQRKAS